MMSAEIKPGQIWQWNSALPGEPDLTVTKVEGDRVSYQYQGEGGECYRDVDHFTERAHLVKDVGTTPAPLDPANVKVGAPVELERDGGKYIGTLAATTTDTMGRLAWVLQGGLQFSMEGPDAWTLTAHTPAPEPEPELPTHVGALGRATVTFDGEEHPDVLVVRPAPDRLRAEWFLPEGKVNNFDFVSSSHLSKFRPLVVIDPAGVDVDALVETACYAVDHWLPAGVTTPATASIRDAVHGVLRYIGIEVPR